MRIGAIIQARSNSSRFPNKVLLALPYQGENTVLDHVLARAEQVKLTECVILATTDDPLDDAIAERPGRQPNWCYRTHPDNALPLVAKSSHENKNFTLSSAERYPARVFRGSQCNVLDRYFQAAKLYQLDHIVRLTADNPCIDPHYIDAVIEKHLDGQFDFSITCGMPLGTNVEIFTFDALQSAHREATARHQQEHVTPFLREHPHRFRLAEFELDVPANVKSLRLTLDYPSDYAMLNIVFSHFDGRIFGLHELSRLVESNPWLADINPNYQKSGMADEIEHLGTAKEMLLRQGLDSAAAFPEPIVGRDES